MGLFGQSTPFDDAIEKATTETNTNENWSHILDVCDKVSTNPQSAKDCLKAIMKRMGHADPHVVMQAITLLDACANNCGKPFHLEIASREFENEFRRLLSKAQPKVSLKMRQVLKNWAENDFKNDPQLNLIPSLYGKLRHEGVDFSNLNDKPVKSAVKIAASKDPNVVSSQQEEDDIAKAIELSLKETKSSPKQQSSAGGTSASASTSYPSLYPSFSGSGSMASITSTGGASNTSVNSQPEPRKVRALYDFEAAEENELTFFIGEIIHVLDDSDPNWWKGFNQRGEGLFPSNFVTADLSVDPERLDINQHNKSKKTVQFEDDARELQEKTEAAAAAAANQRIEIDEVKVDRLLHLLHEANPEDPSQDSDEMLRLEQEVNQMGPLIDAELERVDRKHAQLTQLSSDLVDAINLYHSLMRDDRAAMMSAGAFMGAGIPGMPGAMSGMGYQGPPNPQMLYGAAGFPGVGSNYAQMPQNFGMPSMPYPNTGQMSATTTPTVPSMSVASLGTVAAVGYSTNPHIQMANAVQSQMPIPLQLQNGHVNSPHMNGSGVSVLPQHMSASMVSDQQQLYGNHQQQQQQQQPIQQQMLPHQHEQQQYSQQPQVSAATIASSMPPNTTTVANIPQSIAPQTQQQQQFMASQALHATYIQQQQQQQQQYATMPNGPQSYMTPPTAGVAAGMLQQPPPTVMHNNNNNNNNADQYSQLQHQMAAISLGQHQPVTQNFLVQNEPKNNIPIYQQQR